jgi:dimethylamine/trimethylamine dehydrogenase
MARDAKYDCLFEPIKIGPKIARNRFFGVPHCNNAGSDRVGTQAHFRAMKVEGGWAVACTEYCSVSPDSDDSPHTSARLWDDGDIINLRAMCDLIHSHDGLAGVQLWYGGGYAQGLESFAPQRGPSEYPNGHDTQNYSHEMDHDDIKDVIRLYVEAAKRARAAGFDYIEVICSDSHLPLQFLIEEFNHRTDEYGGSFENRARFWLELLEALKEGVGADCAVGNRYSVDALHGPEGLDLEKGVRYVEMVEARGLCDLWDVKVADYNGWGNDSGPSRFFKAHNQGWATSAVKAVVSVPVVQVGRFTSPDDMADAIRNNECDMIGGARPSIADPFLPKKIEEGRPEDIRECIGCNICVSRFWLGAPMACTQNATAMEEYRRGWHPEKFDQAADPCSVLVVGGGPAGLECSRVLGMRGFDVHLCEASDDLGGNIKNVMRYPGLAEWGRIVSYRQIQLDKLKTVEIHTGIGEMSADDVLSYGADKVVVAVGAHWRDDGMSGVTHAAISGADASQPQICTPEQVMAGKEIGERVVVIDSDGYFTGLGMAEMMADQGKQVTMITDKPAASYYTEYTLEGDNVQRLLVEKDIAVLGNHWVERIEAGNATKVVAFNVYRDGYKIQMPPTPGQNPRKESDAVNELDCDTVILVTARASNDGLFKALKTRQDEWAANEISAIYHIGDCYSPRIPQLCIWEGHRLAREFDSPDPQKPLPYIRERRIWGDDTMPTLAR